MTIEYTISPTKQVLSQIQELLCCCAEYEPVTLTNSREDCSFVLLYDNQILKSFISLFFPEDNICECIGFTHPDSRRSGYFSLCLEKVCQILEEREQETGCEAELALVSDGKSKDAIYTLDAISAEFWYAEHMMEVFTETLIDHTKSFGQAAQIKELHDGMFQIFTPSFCHGDTSPIPQSFCGEDDSLPAKQNLCGSFCLYETNLSACLYELFVEPEFRNQGCAMACLNYIGRYLQKKHIPSLKLQVSGLNIFAVSLYKKAGFQITETLSYYLY